MWTLDFWKDLGERAIRTLSQVLGAGLLGAIANTAFGDVITIKWSEALYYAAVSTAISILMSLGASKVGDSGNASMVLDYRPKHGFLGSRK